MKSLFARTWITWAIIALMVLLAVWGCGGGSGASAPTQPVNLFATDNLRDGYDAVYINLKLIELVASDGTRTSVFESTGRKVNVRRLHDGTNNLYLYLGRGGIPEGKTWNQVRLVVGDQIEALRTGQTSFDRLSVVGAAVPGSSDVAIAYNLTPPRTLVAGDDLAIDFDLANFVINGALVTPVLVDSPRSGIDDSDRHEDDDYEGTVANLSGTSPNFTFTLSTRYGTFNVATSASTAIFFSNNATNPTLANGRRVEVEGFFDVSTETLRATKVKIKAQGDPDDPHEAEGIGSNFSSEMRTFTLAIKELEGFVPNERTMTVALAPSAVFRADNGARLTEAEFFAAVNAIKGGAYIEVEGTASGNTFTARKVKLDDEDDDDSPNEAEVEGLATAINSGGGQLSVTVSEYEGFIPTGPSVIVTTTMGTRYKNGNTEVTRDQFFEILLGLPNNARRVEAEGIWNGSFLQATKLKIDD